MTINEQKEKLAIDLYKSGLTDAEEFFTSFDGLSDTQKERWYRVADFIISDRKRILKPLVKMQQELNSIKITLPWLVSCKEAIDQALLKAGILDGKRSIFYGRHNA